MSSMRSRRLVDNSLECVEHELSRKKRKKVGLEMQLSLRGGDGYLLVRGGSESMCVS
jgi:hypothetical protein